jgi:hypothetical protein
MSRSPERLRPRGECDQNGRTRSRELIMAKYLMLKHYRRPGGPEDLDVAGADWSSVGIPMDQWTSDEIDDHVKYMNDFAAASCRFVSPPTARSVSATADAGVSAG